MKRFSGILLLTLLFAFQSMAMNAPKEIYSIQIGAFSEPQAEHFQFLTALGMVYLEDVPNSRLKKVMVSKFDDKATADEYLKKIQKRGYTDAFIVTNTIDDSKTVKTVQLGSYTIGEKVDLTNAKALGKVHLHIKQNEVRVLIGFYADITSAKIALDKARANGFPSAFMKDTDMVWLQPTTTFEENYLKLGKMVTREVVETYETPSVPKINPNSNPNNNPNNTTKNGTNNGDPTKAKASVAGLQEALKDSKKFKGNVNGVYNDDTRNGLKEFQDNSEMYQLYATRTIDEPTVATARGDVETLQGNIELIEFNPTIAAENLQKFNHPIAKVYLAFLYFTNKATAPSGREIDFLMNDAISQAYSNFGGQARFDYTKKYTYNDVQTILQHYAYVAQVSDDNPTIPCWMVKDHNYELSQAFAGLTPPEFTDCEGFENIKEVRILKAMAQDMDLLSDVQRLENHAAELQAYKARRTELYLNPQKISLPEQELYEMWNTNLLNAVERNIAADPLRKDILSAFKVTYFSVYDKLENHYTMKMEFEEDQAKALALATLYAVVNYNLGDYITNDF
ncbi:MAG: hypothetical protein AB8G11_23025 [Saprospiraceae bacterium]